MHTPGPWRIQWDFNVMGTRRDTGWEGVVATCGGYSNNMVDTTPENRANTRLIAAAPDLLAAAKEATSNPSAGNMLKLLAAVAAAEEENRGNHD